MHINDLGPRCSSTGRIRDRTRTGNTKDRPSSPASLSAPPRLETTHHEVEGIPIMAPAKIISFNRSEY
jgi:hypothetical protein